MQCWGSLRLCTLQTREFLTSLLWIRKNQEASTSLGTIVSFWELPDLEISLSFCAGHICSGVDDKVSELNFNWNLFMTSLPVSYVLLLYALQV